MEEQFHSFEKQRDTAGSFVERDGLFYLPCHPAYVMILVIFADAGQFMCHFDPVLTQKFRLPNAGEF